MENDIAVYKGSPMLTQDQMTPDDIVAQVALIQNVMSKVMRENEHYGKIPGCGDKPTLLMAGAEKLGLTFRLATTIEGEREPIDLGRYHREYVIKCTLTNIPTGQVWGQGVGSCSTMESKYRYRQAERICPDCNNPTIIKGKKRNS